MVDKFKTILAISKLVLGILRLDLRNNEKLFHPSINIKGGKGGITLNFIKNKLKLNNFTRNLPDDIDNEAGQKIIDFLYADSDYFIDD